MTLCILDKEIGVLDKDTVSFVMNGQVHQSWEWSHSDKANNWQVYTGTNVCQINKSQKKSGIYSFGFLYSAQLLVYLCRESWEHGLRFKCATFTDVLITAVLKQKFLHQEWSGNSVCVHVHECI
jgi:hypothetical protein